MRVEKTNRALEKDKILREIRVYRREHPNCLNTEHKIVDPKMVPFILPELMRRYRNNEMTITIKKGITKIRISIRKY